MESSRRAAHRWNPAWVALAALLAISPLLLHGASCGHDLSFHLLNWMEVASQWKHGVLRPFWCYHAAWNAGEPRFVFYPPLSWMLGAVLSMVVPITSLPVAYIFTALTMCGLTMHRFLCEVVSPRTALLISCLYLANPYALFTAFERSAFAELLAAAWIPLLLRAVLRRRMSVPTLAVPVALLWLTNAPAAVAGSYTLLIAGLVRCVQIRRSESWRAVRSFAVSAGMGYLLGLGLASLFLLPAVVQRRWIQAQMAVVSGLRPADNFIFTHTGLPDHDLVLHQASLIAAAILCAGLVCFALLLMRRKHHLTWRSMHDRQMGTTPAVMMAGKASADVLGILLLTFLFLLTPASALVWKYAPELSFLQFPWRLLAVAAAAVAVLLAFLLNLAKLSRGTCIAAGLLFTVSAAWGAHALYFQPCDDEDAPRNQQTLFREHAGSEPTDEYSPSAADNDALQRNLPQAWTAVHEDDPPSADILVTGPNAEPTRFAFSAPPGTGYLVVRLRQFYGWRTTVDGTAVRGASQRNDGLLAIPIGAGRHTVTLDYRWTWDEILGTTLSIFSTLLLWLCVRHQRQPVPATDTTNSVITFIP